MIGGRANDSALPLVLVVDDDAAVGRALAEVIQDSFDAQVVTTAVAALEIIDQREVAIVLADQRMPAMDGLELLTEARRRQPTLVGVLITGHAEVESAIQAINSARVLGFLTKPWDDQELLLVVNRAMEAHHALLQLSRASQEPDRELRMFERYSSGAPVPVTASRFGALPIRDSVPEEFARLTSRYSEILGLALDQRAFKVDHHVRDALHQMADRLGALSAGPRDVIDVHLTAIRGRLHDSTGREKLALTEEGRLLVLELMGDLVAYYRNYTLGVRG